MDNIKGKAKEKLSGITYFTVIKYVVIALVLISLLVFTLVFKNIMDSPVILGGITLLFLLTLHFSGIFKALGELTLEAIFVIILTVVFIQISYPFFSPKIDIISSDIQKGYVDDTGDYIFEIFSATVKKPMMMACGSMCGNYCTDISFFNGVWGEVNAPDVNITKIGDKRAICTYGNFDMMTRLLKFNAAYIHQIDYEVLGTNMSSADEYNLSAGKYFFPGGMINNMPFPLSFKYKTFTFSITNKTKIPVTGESGSVRWVSLYDTIRSNYQKNGCNPDDMERQISNSFRVSDTTVTGKSDVIKGYSDSVKIDENAHTIDVFMKVSGTLEPEKRYSSYIIYDPVTCLK